MTNIVLTGMRGSGKTSMGRILAEKTDKSFIDTDEEIEKKAGLTVPEIVNNKGWDYFRNIEKETIRKISDLDNCVISTGGGVILDPDNIERLKRNGILVYLAVEPLILDKRIGNKKDRPPLKEGNRSLEILAKRQSLYENSADFIFDASADDREEKVKQLLLLLHEYL